ncbi:flagellar basal body-associated FliL family protein [Teichococcus cervicalis]|uniref:Flagellar protein FliL n=1 Tax=Pseudoroseomonas cervicalis ATCC 49957 TaxID=525371 RepID=D5RG33_9PROT|nr:flagellar basal body-associated FliL family protein [Pseudoroseomonas cervicalis]EFH13736.1 flagellar basal body-associated protein FliL [Pseudoroseomonas cervicalis ATCC 49957]
MSATTAEKSANATEKPARKKGGRRRLLILLLPLVLLLGGGAAAWFLVPAVPALVGGLLGRAPAGEAEAGATPAGPAARPSFVEFPEMTLTLPNGGRPRQLRLRIAVEINGDPALLQPELLSPRIYDSLLLYLRTLREGEMEGALAMDRLRGDLHRRFELLLGPGKVRDVLITGFVVA